MMELLPYTESKRDLVEQRLSEIAAKPQIHQETRHGLEITVYYLRKLGTVSMALMCADNTREFMIPNDEVAEAIAHPEVYAYRSGLPKELKNE